MGRDACRLGAFDLGPELARGGMAVVHRGVHRATGTPVAVKVVTGAADASQVRALEREIHQVAQLDHPCIVRVHDQGRLPDEARAHGLEPGRPWLVMDLHPGGSLDQAPPRAWAGLERVLREVLGALAHAHARGLVHRDLKPANVLRSRRDRLVLTDFGIAVAASEAGGGRAGTPWVMAPEQIRGEGRAIGPWTDLYALGCTTWWLLTGRPPFPGGAHERVLAGHLSAPLPELAPAYPVPDGLQDWLRLLLAKDPVLRFQRAADAAWALDDLGDTAAGGLEAAVEAADRWSQASSETFSLDALPEVGAVASQEGPEVELPVAPPVRPRPPSLGDRGFVDAGLGLAGLRRAPLVGREAPWEHLADALARCREEDRAAAIVLHGPAGVGRSWLARNFVEAADEVGAALTLRVPAGLGLDGVVDAAIGALGCGDQGLERWWSARMGAPEEAHLDDLHAGAPEGARRAATWRLLAAMARSRALVVVLDDLDGDRELAALVRHGAGRPGRVLFLGSAREALDLGAGSESLALERLDRGHTRQLIDALVELSADALEALTDLVQGRPGAAVAVVGDLARRGQLEASAAGARVVGELALPSEMSGVLLEALDPLLEGAEDLRALELAIAHGTPLPHGRWAALTGRGEADRALAARLVDAGHWSGTGDPWVFRDGMLADAVRRRARSAGRWEARCLEVAQALDAAEDPLDRMRLGRLLVEAGRPEAAVEPVRQALERFVHVERHRDAAEAIALYVELVDQLDLDPTDPVHCRALGTVIRGWHHLGWNEQIGELGRSWLELPGVREGQVPLAVHAWRGICEQERSRGNGPASLDAARRSYEASLRTGEGGRGIPEFVLARCLADDPARGEESIALFREAIDYLGSSWQSAAWYYIHQVHLSRGRREKAREAIEQAVAVVDGDVGVPSKALVTAARAQFLADCGDVEAGIAGWRAAIPVLERYGYLSEPMGRLNLGSLLLRVGELDEGEREAVRALREFVRTGRRPHEANTCGVLLHAAALRGDLDAARSWFERMTAILDEIVLAEQDLCLEIERAVPLLEPLDPGLARAVLAVSAHHWEGLDRGAESARVKAWSERIRSRVEDGPPTE